MTTARGSKLETLSALFREGKLTPSTDNPGVSKVQIPHAFVRNIPEFKASPGDNLSPEFFTWANRMNAYRHSQSRLSLRQLPKLPLAVIAKEAGNIHPDLSKIDTMGVQRSRYSDDSGRLVSRIAEGAIAIAGSQMIDQISRQQANYKAKPNPRASAISLPGRATIPKTKPEQPMVAPIIGATPEMLKKRANEILPGLVTGIGETLLVGDTTITDVSVKFDPPMIITLPQMNDRPEIKKINKAFDSMLILLALSFLKIGTLDPQFFNEPAIALVLAGKHNKGYYNRGLDVGEFAANYWLSVCCNSRIGTVAEAVILSKLFCDHHVVRGVRQLI